MRVARVGWLLGFAGMAGSSCLAGYVAFLPDGKSLVRCEKTSLWIKDLDDESHQRELKLPADFGEEGADVLTPTADGLLTVANGGIAMTWNPASKEWKELWRPPAERRITGITCDPKTGGILFDTSYSGQDRVEEECDPWFYWEKGAKEPVKVYNRRAPGPVAPSFDAEGNLHFICHGDLWKGYLIKGDAQTPFTLGGKRTWPIADLETESHNRDGALATEVVAFGNKLLVHLDYSHSIGATVRVPNLDAYKEGLPIKWEDLFGECSAPLAVSPDGKTAAMWSSQRWWLMEKPDGEFEPLSKDEEIDRRAKEAEEEDGD